MTSSLQHYNTAVLSDNQSSLGCCKNYQNILVGPVIAPFFYINNSIVTIIRESDLNPNSL